MRDHAEKMFKDVNEAYNLLSDSKKRKIYDEGGHPDDPNSAFHKEDFQTENDLYNDFFGKNNNKPEQSKNYSSNNTKNEEYKGKHKNNYNSKKY